MISLLIVFDTAFLLVSNFTLVILASWLGEEDAGWNPSRPIEQPPGIALLAAVLPVLLLGFSLVFADGTGELIEKTAIFCYFVLLLTVFLVSVLICRRWFSKCPHCERRRGGWIAGKDRGYDFRCFSCGFTKENVWRREE
ncbi:MAG: hypothetical protein RIC55_22060 [Pirellulaceae bacterium]